jgi:hypothetical protein
MIAEQIINARIRRVEQCGRTYYPVAEPDGEPADLETLGVWSHLPDRAHRADVRRRARLLLADETPLRGGPRAYHLPAGWRLRLSALRSGFAPVLTFHATALAIGVIQDIRHEPPGVVPGAVGWCTLADVDFHPTVLGTIAFAAAADGHFTGLCPVIVEPEEIADERLIVGGHLLFVQLADQESMCSPSARVLSTWAERSERYDKSAGDRWGLAPTRPGR